MYARYQVTSLLRGCGSSRGCVGRPAHHPLACRGCAPPAWVPAQRRCQSGAAAHAEPTPDDAPANALAAGGRATTNSSSTTAHGDRRGNFRFSRAQLRGLRPDQMPRQHSLVLTHGADKKFVRRNGDWDCAFCSTVNPSSRWRCHRCSKEKDESEEANGMPKYRDKPIRATEKRSEQPRGDWVCPDDNCGVLNFSRRIECIQCRTARPGSQPRKGDWKCPSCDTLNFAKRTECMRCAGPKVEDDGSMEAGEHRGSDDYEDARQPVHRGGGGRGRGGGGRGGRGGRRENDWECESCGSLNFGFRSECKQCGQPKE